MFRVRAYWTPGPTFASPSGSSFFHVGVDSANGVSQRISPQMSAAIFSVLDRIEINAAKFPGSIKYSHTYVAMLVKTDRAGGTAGGRPLIVVAPDRKRSVAVSLGEDSLHEFAHAYAGISDEYIGAAGKLAKPAFAHPISMFDGEYNGAASNLARSASRDQLPWQHLSPGGEYNPIPNAIVGRLWSGGEGGEYGVWHSEPLCLMNGGHENWNFEKTKRGAWLRDTTRFCFWCEEIVAAHSWYLAGMLGASQDGKVIWQNWTKIRPQYYQRFGIADRIVSRNAEYAAKGLGQSPLQTLPATEITISGRLLSGFRLRNASLGCYLNQGKSGLECTKANESGIWQLERHDSGFARVKNKATNQVIHTEDGTSKPKITKLHAGAWSSHWMLNANSNGHISLTNRWTNSLFSVADDLQVIGIHADPLATQSASWIVEDP